MTARTLRSSSMIIALTGFMGCGKSSVGRELSTLLGLPVVDLDQYIVRKAGRSIADIFAEDGESFFRDLETEALSDLLAGKCTLENVLLRRTPPSKLGSPPLMMPRVAQFSRVHFPAKIMQKKALFCLWGEGRS